MAAAGRGCFSRCACMLAQLHLPSGRATGWLLAGPGKPPGLPRLVSSASSSNLRSRISSLRGKKLTQVPYKPAPQWGAQQQSPPSPAVAALSRLLGSSDKETSKSNSSKGLPPIFFSDCGLDRMSEYREDANYLERALLDPRTQVVPVYKGKLLIRGTHAVTVSAADVDVWKTEQARAPVFLGVRLEEQGIDAPAKAVFALDVAYLGSSETEVMTALLNEAAPWSGARFVDLRQEGPALSPKDAGLLALARGLIHWHACTRFCSVCGSAMDATDGGHALKCSDGGCAMTVHPRLDPAVIMCVTCEDFVLLGRQRRWAPGRYSLLAGFVEVGETIEMAVVREVNEEADVAVDIHSIRFMGSQPWPFPSSFMMGFEADAALEPVARRGDYISSSDEDEGGEQDEVKREVRIRVKGPVAGARGVRQREGDGGSVPEEEWEGEWPRAVDEEEALLWYRLPLPCVKDRELEDVRWVHRDWLRSVMLPEIPGPPLHGSPFSVPGHYAIARKLLDRWVANPSWSARGHVDDNVVGSGPWPGDQFWPVEIDEGVFKYILLRIREVETGRTKLLVRGDRDADDHMSLYDHLTSETMALGLQVEALGGGRIEHYPNQRMIFVYGFSYAFGRADHRLTAALLHQWFPLYDTIVISNEGY